LSSELLARSLAIGFVWGTFPLYIPTFPTVALVAVGKLVGLSTPAAVIGLNIATPFMMMFMVPFIRAGEWIAGLENFPVEKTSWKDSANSAQGWLWLCLPGQVRHPSWGLPPILSSVHSVEHCRATLSKRTSAATNLPDAPLL
ncbi:unnamed protein product, partial [Polarella glacialis]